MQKFFLISGTYLKAWKSIHFKSNYAFSHGSYRKLGFPVHPAYCIFFLLWMPAFWENVYSWIVLNAFHVLHEKKTHTANKLKQEL